jgi:hypothetical protein
MQSLEPCTQDSYLKRPSYDLIEKLGIETLGTMPGFGNTLLIMQANAAQNQAASLVFSVRATGNDGSTIF